MSDQTANPQIQPPLVLAGTKDHLFASDEYPKPFCFNAEVAEVFDDMVSRSVPLYEEVIRSICAWSTQFYQAQTAIYDIGCSTGTTLRAVGETLRANNKPARLVGVDPSAEMLEQAEVKLAGCEDFHKVRLEATAAQDLELSPCSVVLMNYTLQFLPLGERKTVLRKICQSLVPGGILILSEKIRFETAEFQETTTRIYEQFKRVKGYTSTEIARKKEALENVLVPLTAAEQIRVLKAAGFATVVTTMQWHNFATFVAQKGDSSDI